MSCGGRKKHWKCGKPKTVNLQKVGSIVRDFGDPCLAQSPIKVVLPVSKMLDKEKWQAHFDGDGKVSGFHKALKLIILGGVDPSIRPEVWEFLLGCYALSSTAEYRLQLRKARRERYEELIKQCQMMNSSIGTGSLAYVVGSKVMDVRTSSKNDNGRDDTIESSQYSIDSINRVDNFCGRKNNCTDISCAQQTETYVDSADFISVRDSDGSIEYRNSFIAGCGPHNSNLANVRAETNTSQFTSEVYSDFPPLPVTNLFEKKEEDKEECYEADKKFSRHHKLKISDDRMHSFRINNNTDLALESNGVPSNKVSCPTNSEIDIVPDDCGPVSQSHNMDPKLQIVNSLRISDIPASSPLNTTSSQQVMVSEDRVSEWLWTLHRIVVDVVRTDNHLEFYEDTKNLARMSDILAVYAWVDPATGYCQGMSDLLSPFVVLFEDNADAFWCFEMLLRRMRENFQMEGPTGVMNQLQTLRHILELTDKELFAHISHTGSESLHFAFRMLLVLFRRELTFDEALCMWEMMWAADFDESVACSIEANCLESLVLHVPTVARADSRSESPRSSSASSEGAVPSKHRSGEQPNLDVVGVKPSSTHPFCGLTKGFWSGNNRMPVCNSISSSGRGRNELPVFCVAAILISNRQKLLRETDSFDDMIKIFNDNMLKINVKRCVRMAIKLRKKYFYKLIKQRSASCDG